MSETEKAAARAALKEWNGVIGPDFDAYYEAARALREMGQSTKEIEILLYQAEIMDTLATKVSGVRSAFSGAGNAARWRPKTGGARVSRVKTRWALPSAAKARPGKTRCNTALAMG